MNESGSLFHCACLICPLSFLHQPVCSDTAAPPASSRLRSHMHHANKPQATPLLFFFSSSCPPLTTKSPQRLLPSGFLLQTPLRSELETTSTCCLFKFSHQSPAAFLLILRSPYPRRFTQPFSSPNHTPPPPTTSHLPPSFSEAEHIGVFHLRGPACVSVRARGSMD